ncbi:MAG: hypothetical protein M1546_03680 [Chloroflexi bacterium]|nr:hypothetical protein [Chloroflexota bacterium]
MTKRMRGIGWRYRAALGCVLVFAFAWLVACNSTTAPATAVPVTIVFEPASGGVNPALPSGTQPPASQTATFTRSQLSITTVGNEWPITFDTSTPAPPARDVRTYTSAAGVSFDYPANWFTYTKEAENMVLVMNAPPDGIYALKQGGDFRAISVRLKPADMAGYESVRAYIEATLLGQCSECKVLTIEALPPLPQGYTVTQVTYLGEGERAVLFIANGQHVVELSTTYAPGRRSDAKYLEVLDQVANTLAMPRD